MRYSVEAIEEVVAIPPQLQYM